MKRVLIFCLILSVLMTSVACAEFISNTIRIASEDDEVLGCADECADEPDTVCIHVHTRWRHGDVVLRFGHVVVGTFFSRWKLPRKLLVEIEENRRIEPCVFVRTYQAGDCFE